MGTFPQIYLPIKNITTINKKSPNETLELPKKMNLNVVVTPIQCKKPTTDVAPKKPTTEVAPEKPTTEVALEKPTKDVAQKNKKIIEDAEPKTLKDSQKVLTEGSQDNNKEIQIKKMIIESKNPQKEINYIKEKEEEGKNLSCTDNSKLNKNSILGIKNYGNTCHLNSILQAVLRIHPISNWLHNFEKEAELNKSNFSIGEKLLECLLKLNSGNMTKDYILELLVNLYRKEEIMEQQDAQETFFKLMSKLENPNEVNIFKEFFSGKLRRTLTCRKCHDSRKIDETLQTLQISAKHKHLTSNLDAFFFPEDIREINCKNCGQKGLESKYDIVEFPKVLCIQLKRFDNDGKKVQTQILAESTLSIPTYGGNTVQYKINSIVKHKGNLISTGHYTSEVSENDLIHEYNDEVVTRKNEMNTKNAYLLYYELKGAGGSEIEKIKTGIG